MRTPDLVYGNRTAWKVRSTWRSRKLSLGTWLVHCPGYHPLWSYWAVSLVHLRRIWWSTPPKKNRPGSTHEVMFLAVDPNHDPDPDRLKGIYRNCMMPPDLVHQVDGINDRVAALLLTAVVDKIMAGGSPDSDARSMWKMSIDAWVRAR